ncbi:hypothetical protein HPP92_006909 [Vanilla planifolia]|uniref:Uncharacterized protein n=1 Tax=Vanilla planifolia TaxID=51239 RepID=A0A835VBD3_VANPL|nr:hypothetical protein HPP92_006909 [Vanilla planifolia]
MEGNISLKTWESVEPKMVIAETKLIMSTKREAKAFLSLYADVDANETTIALAYPWLWYGDTALTSNKAAQAVVSLLPILTLLG